MQSLHGKVDYYWNNIKTSNVNDQLHDQQAAIMLILINKMSRLDLDNFIPSVILLAAHSVALLSS